MMRWAKHNSGFTIVELLIVIVVIAILAALTFVAYGGVQRQAAASQVMATVKDAGKAVALEVVKNGESLPSSLPSDFHASGDVEVVYAPLSNVHYSGLSTVQHGVLLYELCEQLIQNPNYSTIHSRDGAQTSTIVMSCDDNIQDDRLQITGWETKTWTTPLTQQQIQDYIATVPYDTWWTDKQTVIKRFYSALISMYTSSGGSWPVTSFWDPWATQWSGVQKQNLPNPDTPVEGVNYCIMATHRQRTELSYIVTAKEQVPHTGTCF